MKLLFSLSLLFIALALSGCATSSGNTSSIGDSLHLSVSPAGTVMMDDKAIPRDRLIKSLRKAGANPETTLYINIPENFPLTEVSSLTRTLGSAGYRRVFFKRPKHTESSIIKPQ